MTDTNSDQPRPGWRKKPADHVGHAQVTMDQVQRLGPTRAGSFKNARSKLARDYGHIRVP